MPKRNSRKLFVLGALAAGGYLLSQRKATPARPVLASITQPASVPVRIGWAGNPLGDQWGGCC